MFVEENGIAARYLRTRWEPQPLGAHGVHRAVGISRPNAWVGIAPLCGFGGGRWAGVGPVGSPSLQATVDVTGLTEGVNHCAGEMAVRMISFVDSFSRRL